MRVQQLNKTMSPKCFKKEKEIKAKLGTWTLTTPLTSIVKSEVTSFLPNLSSAYKI